LDVDGGVHGSSVTRRHYCRAVSSTRTLLAGGYTNQVWRVRVGRDVLIEKRYAEHPPEPNPMYPNLPDHEAAALAHLAGTGLVPELMSFTPAHDHVGASLVYRYVVGTQWRRGVGDVARLLHAVHSARAPEGLRSLHRSGAEAIAHADEVIAGVPLADERARLTAHRPTDIGDRPIRRPSLVHTDCGPGNLVRSRSGLVLIDWQCPGVGDPVEDLACFLSPAMMVLYATPPHGVDSVRRFLAAYPDDETVARYRRDGAAWHYRIAAYCLWRHHRLRESQPEVAARYGRALSAELNALATRQGGSTS
jgi:hypothetical protein